jgi:DNA-binding transcriptional LysR family regulator
MRRISLTNLETLCWISKLGSFAAAAEHLHTTQSAISRRVHELQDELRITLFQRQGRRMLLSPQGRQLVERAQPLLTSLDAVIASIEQGVTSTATVRIGVGEMVAQTWLVDLVTELRRHMPDVQYEISVNRTSVLVRKLELGTLDIAILVAPVDTENILVTAIGAADCQWVIGRSLQEASRTSQLSPQQLLEAHTVWCIAPPTQWGKVVSDSLKSHGARPRRINTSDSLQSIIELVANGEGIALLPNYALGQVRGRGEIVPLGADLPTVSLGFALATHRNTDRAMAHEIIEAAKATCNFDKAGMRINVDWSQQPES